MFDEETIFTIKLPQEFKCHADKEQIGNNSNDGSENSHVLKDRLLIIAPDTARIFIYPTGEKSYLTVTCWGSGWTGIEEKPDAVLLKFAKGTSYIALVGGSSYPDVVMNTEQAFRKSYEQHSLKVYEEGQGVIKRLLKTGLRKNIPLLDSDGNGEVKNEDELTRIHELCENIAFLIKAQQSEDGGIIAGHYYPMAYIRDQYGACRGLLALGLFEEVRRNLEFRFK